MDMLVNEQLNKAAFQKLKNILLHIMLHITLFRNVVT